MSVLRVIVLFSLVKAYLADINPSWRDPSAFERRKFNTQHDVEGSGEYVAKTCQSTDPYADSAAAMFYKKFISFIFNRKKMMKDELSNTYLRDIQFQITDEELQKLESTSDIREIDGLISDIIAKSKDSSLSNIVATEISHYLSNATYFLQTKNGMFVIWGTCFALFIWCISRYSKKGIIASALLAMVVVSYAITYMQCNDKKATDKLIKLMEHDRKYTCSVNDKPEAGLLNSLRSFFGSSPDSQCIAKMRAVYSSELDICTPAEVFVVMVAQLNMKYFEEFGHQLINTYKSLTESHWWYEKMFILVVMLVFVVLLAYIFIKFALKYGFQYFSHSTNQPTLDAAAHSQQQQLTELKNAYEGLAKKIKRQKASNPKIVFVESASRVQEIPLPPQAAIDVGATGDGSEIDKLNETDTSVDSDTSDILVSGAKVGETIDQSKKKVTAMGDI